MPSIKRYPNRKLYDTEAKSYVTLDDLTRMIQDGQEVQVIDHESGEDLTNLTLTQIILEQEKRSDSGFLPRALLTGLIRASSDTLTQLRRSLSTAVVINPDLSVEEQGRQMVEQVQTLLNLDEVLRRFNVPSTRDLEELQTRINELTAKLDALNQAEQTGQEQSPGALTIEVADAQHDAGAAPVDG